MAFSVRRVVTGHDDNGKAVVKIDEGMSEPRSNRPGLQGHGVWATDVYPANLNTDADGKSLEPGAPGTTASKFRTSEYGPGVTPRMHRTHSLDYVVIMKGEITVDKQARSTGPGAKKSAIGMSNSCQVFDPVQP